MMDRILVIEDSRTQALKTQLLLQREGYEVETAFDGEEGWERILNWKPDVVLLDINLPRKNGFDLLKEIRNRDELASMQVIMLTAYGDVDSLAKALELGADDYISKPFNDRELSARVKASLRMKKLQDRVIKAERLAAVGALVVTMSHEINNPLTGIIGNCQIILTKGDSLDPEIKERVRSIMDMAGRISKVIQKAANLKDVVTKPYLGDTKMLDLER
ncbi:TPA: hybrid sensor histidine kinase/response regulator [Candidatus Poribacteria bacterium]|nr:hybrid sensor histidine kinase/response regulator [Candidatus Poribacteria bacterium]HEX29202.1 hybrid sensor histidine kinase/response regulator [Candidatus Poribacteria bacterium]